MRALACCGLALFAAASPGVAQEPRGFEAGLGGIATLADRDFAGGGVSVGVRPGGGARIVMTLVAGGSASRFAARGELLGHLLLSPSRPRGLGAYGFAGVAGVVGPRDAGVLVMGLGMEAAPGGRGGWYLEAGVGGGARVAAGWRWRRLRASRVIEP